MWLPVWLVGASGCLHMVQRAHSAPCHQEWEPWEVDVAVPLSPGELERKIEAIFKHQSQKDRALFPGG